MSFNVSVDCGYRLSLKKLAGAMLALGLAPLAHAQVSLTTLGTAYTQSFDGLPASGTATVSNNSTIPGWFFARTGTGATIVANDGASNAGNLYSYGTTGATDRALGSVGSANAAAGNFFWGVRLQNNTGATINSLDVSYTGEQWRNSAAAAQTIAFSYLLGSPAVTGSLAEFQQAGVAVTALDFTGPVTAGTAGAINGNLAANRVALTTTISGLNIPNGSEVILRWSDPDQTGADHGLSIDDVSITPRAAVVTPNFSISAASPNPVIEGAASDTTVVNFEVRLSQASPGATVSFTTADGTATAGSDYTAKTQTLTFTGSQVSMMVPVTILGDSAAEPAETFTASLSNASSGTAIDSSMASGTASIMDDDGTPSLSIADVSVLEGNSGSTSLIFTVTLSPANSASTVTVTATTADGSALAGSDYTASSATLSFPANSTMQTFTVPVTGDTNIEGDESLTVTLTAATNAQISRATATGTIGNDDVNDPMACGMPASKISAAQGTSDVTPLNNTQIQIEGVVVGDFQGATGLAGFYVEEETADQDADPATSEGIFVVDPNPSVAVMPGQVVRVAGTVNEANRQTQISSVSAVMICNAGPVAVAPVEVTLPFATLTTPERYEGMLVRFGQTLAVTNNFTLGRFGEFELSSNGRLPQPTQVVLPGAPANAQLAANNLNRILVDDANSTQNRDPVAYPTGGLSADNTLRGGDTVAGATGVLGYGFNVYRLQPTVAPVFAQANPRTAAPTLPGTGSLRVASFNVLNYFNGDGMGAGFPTARGANTAAEFTRQRTKIISAISVIRPDVVGLLEIENDGYLATSAIADLVNGLNAAAPSGISYAYINPGRSKIGTDEIAVGFIYRVETVRPTGASAILDSTVDARFIDTRNRPSLAQTFTQIVGGGKFTAVINHLKSKGSACDEAPDQMDGQGNCNGTRNQAALALKDWLATDPTRSGDPDYLLLGDFNSYAKEDPIRTLEAAGFINLVEAFNPAGTPTLAYQFDGLWGTLDYGLANASLRQQVTGATEWLINGPEPVVLDYNTEFKTANQVNIFYSPGPYRSSDHDPAVIELALTPCAAGALSFKAAPYAVTETNGDLVASFNVQRTGGSCGAVAVTVASSSGSSGSATEGSDYTAVNTTLNWADADADDKSFSVTIKGDAVEETTESFGLGLGGASNGATSGAATTVTISDDDAPVPVVTAIAPVTSPSNASNASFTLSFSRPVTGVDAADLRLVTTGLTGASIASVSGSGSNYTIAVNTGTGSGSLRVDLADDDSIVSAENKPLGGTGAGNGDFAGAALSVDRTGPAVTVEQAQGQVDPATTSPVRFTATFSEVVSGFEASDVTVAGSAFTASATPAVTITGNGSVYQIAISGFSGNGTVTASVKASAVTDAAGNSSGASSSADNSVSFSGGSLPTVRFTAAAQTVGEAAGSLTATVSLSAVNPTQTVTVAYASANGTAVAGPGGDFAAGSGSLSFAPGETSKTILVGVTDDAAFEGDESFNLVLSNPVNASLGNPSTQTVTLADNDVPPNPPTPPPTGPIRAMTVLDVAGRSLSATIDAGSFLRATGVPTPAQAPPPDRISQYLNGFLAFDIGGLTPGAAVTLTLNLPAGAKPTRYLKCVRGSCANYRRASISGNVVTLTLIDGGDGDDDGLANGVIRDPGAPVTDLVGQGGGSFGSALLVVLGGVAALRRRWIGLIR